jgi:hypothetical protein
MSKPKSKVEWVGIRVLRDEFKVDDARVERWRKRGLIKFKEINWSDRHPWDLNANTRYLYDKQYFASVHKELRNNDFLARIESSKKYSRKLAAVERDIELGKI